MRPLQSLRRSPAFTLAAIVSLALALGAAMLTFGLAEAILLRPLPFPAEERLVAVQAVRLGSSGGPGFVSLPEVHDFSRLASFAAAGASRAGFGLTLPGERIPAEAVSADLFPALGVPPLLGRGFTAGEDRMDAPDVVLLGYDLWQRRFGGDSRLVGRTIETDRGPFRVVGVMPRGFRYPFVEEAWIPLAKKMPPDPPRVIRNLSMSARLRPGVSLEAAQAEASRSPRGWPGNRRRLTRIGISGWCRCARRGAAAGCWSRACRCCSARWDAFC